MSEESDRRRDREPKPPGTTPGDRPKESPAPPVTPASPGKQQQTLPEGEDGHWDRPDD